MVGGLSQVLLFGYWRGIFAIMATSAGLLLIAVVLRVRETRAPERAVPPRFGIIWGNFRPNSGPIISMLFAGGRPAPSWVRCKRIAAYWPSAPGNRPRRCHFPVYLPSVPVHRGCLAALRTTKLDHRPLFVLEC